MPCSSVVVANFAIGARKVARKVSRRTEYSLGRHFKSGTYKARERSPCG